VAKLLISPWGNPSDWKEIEYRFNGKIQRANTPVKLLMEELKPDKSLVFVLDTLANLKEQIKDFSTVQNSVCDYVKKYISEFGLDSKQIKLYILPGVGKFKNGQFIGSAEDLYYFAFFYIGKEILKLINDSSDEKIEVFFDSTHGINYAPILILTALNDILSIIAFFRKVILINYNSDPSDRYTREDYTHNINLIYSATIEPRLRFKLSNSGGLFKPFQRNLNMKDLQLTFKEKKKATAFLNAFINAMPLVFLSIKPTSKDMKEIIDKAIKRYFENVQIDGEVLKRILSFTNTFDILLKSWFLTELLELHRFEGEKITLEDLKKVSDRLYKDKWEFEYEKIMADIGEVENYGNRIPQDWTLYREIVDAPPKGITKRNLIAHSGMLYETTELKKEGGKIFLRLKQEAIEEVLNNLC